jgi:enterochelin esterase-like enzyme
MISRRAFLAGGLGAAGLAAAAGCSASSGSSFVPTGSRNAGTETLGTGTIVAGSFVSRYRRADTGWAIVYPPGHVGDHLPVLVALHGRGGNHTSPYAQLHLDGYLADAVAQGLPPFAIASADGGSSSYWHPRTTPDRTDPAGMVIHEFLPLLARHGLRTSRIGLYGWSMGGYGALYLGERLGRRQVAVVVAESPAIWHHSWQSVQGAFDDAEDWRRHSIWRHLANLRGIAMKIDCGQSDGFWPVTRDLRARIHPTPAGGIEPGGHDGEFWESQAPAAIHFAGRHLAAVGH